MIDTCYVGDVRDGLRSFIAAGVRVQTCVTSPPYWGLRDYGVAGQIGLEPTIAEYVATMVDVFRLVRDVLAYDGTLWLNLGDSYSGNGGYSPDAPSNLAGSKQSTQPYALQGIRGDCGLPPKNMCGIPWRVALALQADGWYLRSDIIWAKPNPMPESVTDRPTKAHEYLFLLSKRPTYYYDAAAIMEPVTTDMDRRAASGHTRGQGKLDDSRNDFATLRPTLIEGCERNRRSVWTIATQPYADAHFAVMPRALVEPCVLAGSRVGDVVLDPFMGSGTVAQVAQDLGRHWLGCELNSAYVKMQDQRTAQTALLLA